MTKLLEQAIAKVRDLPADDQDTLAVALLSMASDGSAIFPLDELTRAAIREGLDQALKGRSSLTTRLRRSGIVMAYEGAPHATSARRSRRHSFLHR